ncbi:pyruvate formate-lyase-activating protein [Mycoplasma sp. P36-A1]|uniref:pyruvate formate-lyase-activating protein n=1 Tax=Mycoplasma sp. P36-A1 TaxID=3252900 RepID=UPI003C301095
MNDNEIVGYVNQYESMGNLDGPGTRFVLFLQGCSLRCQYCHNPETFEISHNKEYAKTVEEVFNDIMKLKEYYLHDGGVTISGGEPLLQPDFVLALSKKLKKANFHVAIDTSGANFENNNTDFNNKIKEIVDVVDLFLVDIKHIDNDKCIELTTKPNTNTLSFIDYLSEKNKKVWIRYVLVPTKTDDEEDLKKTGDFILKHPNIENVDILKYHSMAKAKWDKLGLKYQLKNRDANVDDVNKAYKIMFPSMF